MACRYFHCANTITVGQTTVLLGFVDTATAENKDRFCFRLMKSIPETAYELPVYVSMNGTSIPLLNKYGNPVLGKDLRTRVNYHGYYGVTTPHVIIHNVPRTYNCSCNNVIS